VIKQTPRNYYENIVKVCLKMDASDTNSAPTKSECKAAENKAATHPDAISPVLNQTGTAAAVSPVTDSLSLDECIRVAFRRQVAEHLLWSDEQKEQVSKRLIQVAYMIDIELDCRWHLALIYD